MTSSHKTDTNHDHSKMDHDHEKMMGKVEAHTEHTNHTTSANSPHEMHAAHANHTAHDMGMESEHAGHVDHSGHEDLFRKRFWVSLLLSIPVLLYTPMLQMWLGFRVPELFGSQWITPLFSVIVFLYGGVPFIQM